MNSSKAEMVDRIVSRDPYLKPYTTVLLRRMWKVRETAARLTRDRMTIRDVASGHEYFGLHFRDDGWVFREWAPNATGDWSRVKSISPYWIHHSR